MEAIIFDFGGVLCFHPTDRQLNELAALCGLSEDHFRRVYWDLRIPYDRGDWDGAGYWAAFAKAAGKHYSAEQVRNFIRHDVAFWTSLDQRMLKWIREMRVAGIKLGLISNLPSDLGEHLRVNTTLYGMFDHVTLSYEQRTVKPDPAIYRECVAGLGVAPGQALFLDDKEPNVIGAREAGLQSLVFETPEQLSALLCGEAHDLLPFGTPPIDLG